MSQDIATLSQPLEAAITPDLLLALVQSLTPALSEIVSNSIETALAANVSPTMSKKEFAKINGISDSLLEKWIAKGVVLLAPTPTTTVKRNYICKKTGREVNDVMEKHGNALINLDAWRERNRQHALKCRYIKP
ncbi:hypothetical protein [Yersinia ruckeri]|uniref:hypothetical protein n=1 Tax=Yersinia ruckeri TaxID=29486 RepID=UPI0005E0FEF3|nr:hypothetical protein [Yersinia ruckeri]EKN3360988.1 hypothetical protein [Yersinia ruckeri]EKN3363451.1 hypothetical protein [Yersinia ruckeri]EKN4200785.1 hypothetical protein [Yersinia ruckeri]EKN4725430.1 hypothetical protein [Yersinia ruckeri]ELV7520318.1 hypothetical protein [Yersinia ruckeri]